MKLSPARVAAFLAGLSGLAGAIAVPVANLDTHDTSAVIGGMAVIAAAVVKWLDGQQKHEARQARSDDDSSLPGDDEHPDARELRTTPADDVPPDEGDKGSA